MRNLFQGLLFLVFVLFSHTALAGRISVFYSERLSAYSVDFDYTLQRMARLNTEEISTYCSFSDARIQYQQIEENIRNGDTLIVHVDTDDSMVDDIITLAKKNDARVFFIGLSVNDKRISRYEKAWNIGFECSLAVKYMFELVEDYMRTFPEYDRNRNGRMDGVFFLGPQDYRMTYEIMEAFVNYLKKNSIVVNPIGSVYNKLDYASAYEKMKKLIEDNGLENIDVAFVSNGEVARGVVRALNEYGYNYPNSLSREPERHIPVFVMFGVSDALYDVQKGVITGAVQLGQSSVIGFILSMSSSQNPFGKVKNEFYSKVNDNHFLVPFRTYSTFSTNSYR